MEVRALDRGIEAVVVASLDGCGLTGPATWRMVTHTALRDGPGEAGPGITF